MTRERDRKEIELFLQGEGLGEVVLIRVPTQGTIHDIIEQAKNHGISADDELLVFAEDEEDPLSPDRSIEASQLKHRGRIHVHRCRRVKVTVNYNALEKSRVFAPAATVARVKKWAVGDNGFDLDDVDAAEHVLQICESDRRPDDDTHIGSLVTVPACSLCFDLLPKVRIEG